MEKFNVLGANIYNLKKTNKVINKSNVSLRPHYTR
jgi:hypothetical protein